MSAGCRSRKVTVRQQGREVDLADLRYLPRAQVAATGSTAAGQVTTASTATPPDSEPWVFLIDDLAMSPDAFARVKAGLLAMLERGIPPRTEVGLLRTGELGRRTTQLSADRQALLRTVSALRYANNRWRGGRMSRSGATGAGNATGDRVFLEGTLGSLNSLLIDLRSLSGRKVVIVLSEFIALTASDADQEPGGLGFTPGTQAYANVADRLRRLGRLAAESGVTVHTVDLAGVNHLGSRDRAAADEGLHAVADELGGAHFGNSNEVALLLERLVAAEGGQYVLSYVPPDGTFGGGKPRFVPITVSVSEPGVTVRTRSGFFTR
jgi:VWFA-related protein